MDRGSETQLQVTENLNFLAQCSKGEEVIMYGYCVVRIQVYLVYIVVGGLCR